MNSKPAGYCTKRPAMDGALPGGTVLCGTGPECVLCSALVSAIVSAGTH